jgi:hypothetical protein
MTEFQEAIADGVAAISAAQASVWSFGALVFTGAESDLKPNDPRMTGATDRLIELRVMSAGLPIASYPKRGDVITRGGESYRVNRADHFFASGLTIFLLSRSSAPVFPSFDYTTPYTSFKAYANAAGNTSIAAPSSGYNTAQVTFSGVAGVRNLVLAPGLAAGAVMNLALIFPATAGINARVRNLTVGGTLLFDLVVDDSAASAALELVWNGAAWAPFKSTYPA